MLFAGIQRVLIRYFPHLCGDAFHCFLSVFYYVSYQPAHKYKVVLIKSPCGRRGRPHPYAAGDSRLACLVGYAVLVYGYVGPVQKLLDFLARKPVRSQIQQKQMVVRMCSYYLRL